MSDRIVTVVIHGTFASKATWWQLGTSDDQTFADHLEERLAQDGMAETVWLPALAAGMTYDDFTWSGENRHKDRIAGARKISRSLGELARRLGTTASDPLYVNVVTHSHGGNVALETLEGTTEHFVLGFRWLSVIFNNYEMVDFGTDGPYESDAIRRVDVSDDLVPVLISKLAQWRPASMMVSEATPDQTEQERHIEALRGTILGVTKDISRQMQLRHTVYYETDSVVERTADSLTD